MGFLLSQIGRAHRYHAQMGLNRLGLHIGQEMVIMHLLREDGQTQSQLADAMCVEPPTLTKMLSRMETVGWVERRGDPDDGRISRVYLTERARNLAAPMATIWDDLEARMMAGISEVEQAFLRRLMAQMYKNLEADAE